MIFFGKRRNFRLSMHRRVGQPKGANTPCALSDYLRYQPKERIPMMDHECHSAFLNWIAYHQSSRPVENISCPLTGCAGKDFKNFESYLQHVVACRYLRSGKYQCSDCKREECFLPSTQTQKLVKAYKPGKDSSLRDVVTSFFRQFGRKKSPDQRHELHTDAVYPSGLSGLQAFHPSDDHMTSKLAYDTPINFPASSFGLETTVPEILTMYRGSYMPLPGELPASWTQPSELGAQKSMYLQYELPSPLDFMLGAEFSELSGTRSYLDRSKELESVYYHNNDGFGAEQWPNSTRESLGSAMLSPEPLPIYRPRSHSPNCSSDDGIMHTEDVESDQGGNNTSRDSSRSADGHNSLLPGLGLSTLRGSSRSGSTTPVAPGQANLKLNIPRNFFESMEGLQSDYETAPKQTLSSLRVENNKPCPIDDCFQIVESLEDVWTQKLKTSPELSLRTSHFYLSPVFLGGLSVLRRFFIPNFTATVTTTELFQFMHIAVACTWRSSRDDGRRYPCEALYQEKLRWSQKITKLEDRELYFEVTECLWTAPENVQHDREVCASGNLDTHLCMSSYLAKTIDNGMEVEGSLAGRQDHDQFQDAHDTSAMLSQFEGSLMMRNCMRFLDDFICANVFERMRLGVDPMMASRRSMGGISEIDEMLLRPILQDQRFEAFHAHVQATRGLLYDGILLNFREAEALLMAKSHLPRATELLCQDYIQSINNYCDAFFGPGNLSWRNHYYATCIDSLEAMHIEKRNRMVLDGDNNVDTPSDGGAIQPWDPDAGLDSITPTSAVTVESSDSSGTSKSSSSIGTSSTLPLLNSPASSVSTESPTYNHTSPTNSKSPVTTNPCPTSSGHHQSSSICKNYCTSQTNVLYPVSPTSTSPGTVIAPSPASSNHSMATPPDDNKAYCQWCSKSFSGTRYNREYNLKRHMNDIHQQGSRYRCLEPGCEKTCGRADNLRNHRLKIHGIDDPRVRPSDRKSQRKSTRRRSRTPPSLTRPQTHKPSLW